MRERHPPGNLTAAAILLMTYGSLMLLCSGIGAIQAVVGNSDVNQQVAKEVPSHPLVNVAHAVSNFVVGGGMILAGVLLLNLSRLGQVMGLLLCCYELVGVVAHSAYLVAFVFPVTQRLVDEQMRNLPPGPLHVDQMARGSMWLSLGFTVILTVGFCGPIIGLLTSAKVRDAFHQDGDDDSFSSGPTLQS